MTLDEEKQWRNLCQQAISERDVAKLLGLFLKINRLEERQRGRPLQLRAHDAKDSRPSAT